MYFWVVKLFGHMCFLLFGFYFCSYCRHRIKRFPKNAYFGVLCNFFFRVEPFFSCWVMGGFTNAKLLVFAWNKRFLGQNSKESIFECFGLMRTWGVSTCKFRNFWRKLVLIEAYNTLWWAKGVPKQVYATQGHVLETHFSMYGLYSTYAILKMRYFAKNRSKMAFLAWSPPGPHRPKHSKIGFFWNFGPEIVFFTQKQVTLHLWTLP